MTLQPCGHHKHLTQKGHTALQQKQGNSSKMKASQEVSKVIYPCPGLTLNLLFVCSHDWVLKAPHFPEQSCPPQQHTQDILWPRPWPRNKTNRAVLCQNKCYQVAQACIWLLMLGWYLGFCFCFFFICCTPELQWWQLFSWERAWSQLLAKRGL